MKKIFLLFAIFISLFTATAQSSRTAIENLQNKNTQIASSAYSAEGFIESISVYPNPVTDMLKFTFRSSRNCMAVISLFNTIGKQVYSQGSEVEPGNNIISIDIRNNAIEPGIYFVQFVAEQQVFTRKLIIK